MQGTLRAIIVVAVAVGAAACGKKAAPGSTGSAGSGSASGAATGSGSAACDPGAVSATLKAIIAERPTLGPAFDEWPPELLPDHATPDAARTRLDERGGPAPAPLTGPVLVVVPRGAYVLPSAGAMPKGVVVLDGGRGSQPGDAGEQLAAYLQAAGAPHAPVAIAIDARAPGAAVAAALRAAQLAQVPMVQLLFARSDATPLPVPKGPLAERLRQGGRLDQIAPAVAKAATACPPVAEVLTNAGAPGTGPAAIAHALAEAVARCPCSTDFDTISVAVVAMIDGPPLAGVQIVLAPPGDTAGGLALDPAAPWSALATRLLSAATSAPLRLAAPALPPPPPPPQPHKRAR